MAVSGLLYFNLWRLGLGSTLRWLSALPALAYGGSIIFGPSFAYHRLRRMGIAQSGAVALALLPLLLWMIKEALRLSSVFPPGPSFYYLFNPLHIGIALGALGQMGMVEIGRRHFQVRRQANGPAVTRALVAATLLPWALLLAMQVPDQGVSSYFRFLSGYSRLFEGHSLEYK